MDVQTDIKALAKSTVSLYPVRTQCLYVSYIE